jgi:hypothetical protein
MQKIIKLFSKIFILLFQLSILSILILSIRNILSQTEYSLINYFNSGIIGFCTLLSIQLIMWILDDKKCNCEEDK